MGNCVKYHGGVDRSTPPRTDEGPDPPAPGLRHARTVQAHEALSSRDLGVPAGLPRESVRVDARTMDHLQVGQMTNRVVKDVLDTGAGNQAVDIAASGGESWAR